MGASMDELLIAAHVQYNQDAMMLLKLYITKANNPLMT